MKTTHLVTPFMALALIGCHPRAEPQGEPPVSIEVPERLFLARPFNPDALLSGISIKPVGAVLGRRELLHVSSFLHQTHSLAQADGINTVTLRRESSLFKSIDASLRGLAEWEKVKNDECVDLATVVAIIERSQRR